MDKEIVEGDNEFLGMQFPGKQGSDIHKPTEQQEQEEILNLIKPKPEIVSMIEEKYKKIFFDIWEEGKSSDKLMCAVENLIEELIAGRSKNIEREKELEKELEESLLLYQNMTNTITKKDERIKELEQELVYAATCMRGCGMNYEADRIKHLLTK